MADFESKLFRGKARAPVLTEEVLDKAITNLYGLHELKLRQESRARRRKHSKK